MADPVTTKLAQSELHGAVSTIARAAGCHVIPLHRNITNPRNQSDPDLLCMKPGMPLTFVKCLITGNLTPPQAKIKNLILEDETSRYLIATPTEVADGTVSEWFR